MQISPQLTLFCQLDQGNRWPYVLQQVFQTLFFRSSNFGDSPIHFLCMALMCLTGALLIPTSISLNAVHHTINANVVKRKLYLFQKACPKCSCDLQTSLDTIIWDSIVIIGMLCLYPLHFLHIDHRHVFSSSVHLLRPKWRQWHSEVSWDDRKLSNVHKETWASTSGMLVLWSEESCKALSSNDPGGGGTRLVASWEDSRASSSVGVSSIILSSSCRNKVSRAPIRFCSSNVGESVCGCTCENLERELNEACLRSWAIIARLSPTFIIYTSSSFISITSTHDPTSATSGFSCKTLQIRTTSNVRKQECDNQKLNLHRENCYLKAPEKGELWPRQQCRHQWQKQSFWCVQLDMLCFMRKPIQLIGTCLPFLGKSPLWLWVPEQVHSRLHHGPQYFSELLELLVPVEDSLFVVLLPQVFPAPIHTYQHSMSLELCMASLVTMLLGSICCTHWAPTSYTTTYSKPQAHPRYRSQFRKRSHGPQDYCSIWMTKRMFNPVINKNAIKPTSIVDTSGAAPGGDHVSIATVG